MSGGLALLRAFCQRKTNHQIRKCCVTGLILMLSLRSSRTRKDLGLETKNWMRTFTALSNSAKRTLQCLLDHCLSLACAVSAMEWGSLRDGRCITEEHGWVREKCRLSVWKCLQEKNEKERTQQIRTALIGKNSRKINEFFAFDKLNSPSVVENSASEMLDVSDEESDLFQQDVNAKGKYEEKQKKANVNSIKFGGGRFFP